MISKIIQNYNLISSYFIRIWIKENMSLYRKEFKAITTLTNHSWIVKKSSYLRFFRVNTVKGNFFWALFCTYFSFHIKRNKLNSNEKNFFLQKLCLFSVLFAIVFTFFNKVCNWRGATRMLAKYYIFRSFFFLANEIKMMSIRRFLWKLLFFKVFWMYVSHCPLKGQCREKNDTNNNFFTVFYYIKQSLKYY